MRIVAGAFRGRRLHTPGDRRIRPTIDRVREALFSIIAPHILEALVLDLFAGTGALGLEALSRGADRAVFVDQSAESIRLVRENVELCGVADRVKIVRAPVPQAVRQLKGSGESFDLIFMDPPYGQGIVERTLPLLDGLARAGTLIVVEHHVKDVLPAECGGWVKQDERRYGDTSISFYDRSIPVENLVTLSDSP